MPRSSAGHGLAFLNRNKVQETAQIPIKSLGAPCPGLIRPRTTKNGYISTSSDDPGPGLPEVRPQPHLRQVRLRPLLHQVQPRPRPRIHQQPDQIERVDPDCIQIERLNPDCAQIQIEREDRGPQIANLIQPASSFRHRQQNHRGKGKSEWFRNIRFVSDRNYIFVWKLSGFGMCLSLAPLLT